MANKVVALVDADIMVFMYAITHQETIDWSGGGKVTSVIIQEEEAITHMEEWLDRLLTNLKCSSYILCFSDDLNFRYKVLPTYKHNRANKTDPILRDILKQYCKDNHPWKSKPKLEADDLMGILATMKYPKNERRIIATIDKDLLSIPGWHYNWNDSKKGVFRISEREADWNFFYQMLIGDSTDGYTGIPRVGPVKASHILSETPREDWWRIAVIVATQGITEKAPRLTVDELLQQARVARILRAEDYDFKNEEVILWKPKAEDVVSK